MSNMIYFWNGLLTTVDVVGISLSSYPKVNKAQEIKTKQKVVVLSIAQKCRRLCLMITKFTY